jgi:HK97 gp10 family phage protein
MPIRLEGREKVMAKLRALVPSAEKEMGLAMLAAGHMLADKIRAVAPIDDPADTPGRPPGRYRNSIRAAKLADEGTGGATRLASTATKDKNAVGIYGEYVWRFLEFGTSRTVAQPHVFPIFRANKKMIRQHVNAALKRSIKRAGF